MRRLRSCVPIGACAAAAMLAAGCAPLHENGAVAAFTPLGPSDSYLVPVRSMEQAKFNTVIRQRYDFSCGSAALATLLRYHYDRAEDEESAFRGMWEKGEREQIRSHGFSLLDMKRYLASMGFKSDGFKVTLDQVRKAGVPGIALIEAGGYKHFVVVKAIAQNEVLVGDPALGLRVIQAADFQKSWNGIYFVLNAETAVGRAHFGTRAQWDQYPRVLSNAVFLQPLSQQALMLTAPFYRDF